MPSPSPELPEFPQGKREPWFGAGVVSGAGAGEAGREVAGFLAATFFFATFLTAFFTTFFFGALTSFFFATFFLAAFFFGAAFFFAFFLATMGDTPCIAGNPSVIPLTNFHSYDLDQKE
ncbi:hypothetical protein LEP1GSC058_3582 [Leptospira fainei serovar Hurstbridge str. BUT 6]|uniref:Uncharacterized protein n=1 Tax=Leptospira fainei serovar Hurstbridge str. BUT 6 TaxID=1193011 RepID=S3UVN6_9LEPT|nr:hypothetical protein LEP1GSC058_3582 [Leptospira fainei serovar Hurstbridge str. BUT 6]